MTAIVALALVSGAFFGSTLDDPSIDGKLMRVNFTDKQVTMLEGDFTKRGQEGAPASDNPDKYTLQVNDKTSIHWKGSKTKLSLSELRDLSESAITVPIRAIYGPNDRPNPDKPLKVKEIILTGEKPENRRR